METKSFLPLPDSMKQLVCPTLVITLFAIGGQAVGLVTQVVIAAAFGAGADMDAFLAANTLPQYITAVLLNALAFVFIPMFVEYIATGRKDEAWQVASGVITLCVLALGTLALGGVFFAKPLLHLTTPGLSPESLGLAVRVAMITWPTIVATCLASLLTGIYQAQTRFSWPSAVPFIGALVNLGLVATLARPLAVVGIAIAAAASLTLQFVLLLPIALGPRRFHWHFNWRHPGVRQVLHLLWPLVLSGLLIRWTPIIDRYLASGQAEGAISHLGYAFKLLGVLTLFIATGITTVVFPRMALNTAGSDMVGLRHTVSMGLRIMWLAIAPTIAIGAVLAQPVTTALFQRGAFSVADAQSVAVLLRVYLLALAGACLGNIGGRTFYALKDTRTIAAMGAVEALAYAIYTPLLARWLGIVGVALGYVLYFDLSPAWWLPVLRYKMGKTGGRTVLTSFIRTGVAALLGGAGAWAVTAIMPGAWLQLILGSVVGMIVYLLALLGTRSPEAQMIWRNVWEYIRLKRSVSIPA
jgi:putative peptidoglycan lipid II flippase